MKLSFHNEFFFQVVALLAAFVAVHAIYIGVVRPNAEILLAAQASALAAGETLATERSLWVFSKISNRKPVLCWRSGL